MRNNKRVIYTSSYDRGLEHLLAIWPKVRESVSDAELHVFYGFELFDRFYKDNPASMMWKAKILEGFNQPGVTDHGRVPQEQLVKEYEKSGVWAYPTHFGEINCISSIKAQAYGCEPVVINYAALQETVQFGRKIDGDIYDEETKILYTAALIDALEHPMPKEKREKMMKWAREKYGWQEIAKQWSEVFKQ